ncbi:MAG: DUF4168 domain-containing protein [Leptolyngbya sp.]|nr:DUF4168 domain-containing protein [Leptolyngbya sp.]
MVHSLLALIFGLVISLGLVPSMAQASSYPTLAVAPMAVAAVPAVDIQTFAKAYQAMQTIRDEAETSMAAAVEAEGFTVEDFNALADQALADQSPPADAAVAQRFEAAIERIVTLRQGAETDMATAIEKTGMSLDRFNEILAQSEQDADLYQRIDDQINGG